MLLSVVLASLECTSETPYENPDNSCTERCQYPWIFANETAKTCDQGCPSGAYEDGPNGTFRCLESCGARNNTAEVLYGAETYSHCLDGPCQPSQRFSPNSSAANVGKCVNYCEGSTRFV